MKHPRRDRYVFSRMTKRDRCHTVGLFREKKEAVILLQNIYLLLMMGELNLSFGISCLL